MDNRARARPGEGDGDGSRTGADVGGAQGAAAGERTFLSRIRRLTVDGKRAGDIEQLLAKKFERWEVLDRKAAAGTN